MPLQITAQDSLPKPAQDTAVPKSKNTGYLASYWYNGVKLVTSPVHWKADQWSKAGATLVITGVVVAMDEPISQPFFNWQTNFAEGFGDVGYTIGSVPFQLGITGVALGAGVLAHNQPLKDFALDNLQAQIYTGGLTWIVKQLTHRERPNTGNGPYEWHGPFEGSGNESFFSGHSSIAFSTATMIFLHSKRKWWVGLLSYGVSTGVAISRMQRQAHWASDVLMGAVIGTAVSSFVYKQQEMRRHPKQTLKTLP